MKLFLYSLCVSRISGQDDDDRQRVPEDDQPKNNQIENFSTNACKPSKFQKKISFLLISFSVSLCELRATTPGVGMCCDGYDEDCFGCHPDLWMDGEGTVSHYSPVNATFRFAIAHFFGDLLLPGNSR